VTVLTVDQPQTDHNVDWIGFSPRPGDEGNLYICSGDGGHIEDNGPGHLPGGNAQSTATLLGKILRIHIEDDGTYTIPPDNPFFGSTTDKQEIWSFGLRNPFRASFDPLTGAFYIGDVGETLREELDVQKASSGGGQNYGWRVLEGTIHNPRYADDPPPPDAIDPVFDYDHETTGLCIIGGYVYCGTKVPDLRGIYVFGDCFGPATGDFTGRVFTLRYQGGVVSNFTNITSELFPTRIGGFSLGCLSSFGQDANGEIYMTDWCSGNIFKIRKSRN
jgi:glucose/arabinose dehydrogenase